MHSKGAVLKYSLHGEDVRIDNLEAQDIAFRLSLRLFRETPTAHVGDPDKDRYSYEWDVFMFGCLFYEILFNIYFSDEGRRKFIVNRPPEPEIDGDTWQLIQRCCAENPKDRPTIDEVIEEMQSWLQ